MERVVIMGDEMKKFIGKEVIIANSSCRFVGELQSLDDTHYNLINATYTDKTEPFGYNTCSLVFAHVPREKMFFGVPKE